MVRPRASDSAAARKVFVLAGKEDRLNIEFAANQLAKDLRNVAAANPTGIHKHRELLRIQTERTACCLRRFFAWDKQTSDAPACPKSLSRSGATP